MEGIDTTVHINNVQSTAFRVVIGVKKSKTLKFLNIVSPDATMPINTIIIIAQTTVQENL